MSEDGRYLFVSLINGTSPRNELYYADLGSADRPDVTAKLQPLYTRNDAEYSVVGVQNGYAVSANHAGRAERARRCSQRCRIRLPCTGAR